MKENIIQTKSYGFAIRVVKLYKFLIEEKKEFVLSKQLLKCGTSIGANVEEGEGGQTKKDFIAKMSIAFKEAMETNYWLRIMRDTDYITTKQFESINDGLKEIIKLLTSILNTSKANISQ